MSSSFFDAGISHIFFSAIRFTSNSFYLNSSFCLVFLMSCKQTTKKRLEIEMGEKNVMQLEQNRPLAMTQIFIRWKYCNDLILIFLDLVLSSFDFDKIHNVFSTHSALLVCIFFSSNETFNSPLYTEFEHKHKNIIHQITEVRLGEKYMYSERELFFVLAKKRENKKIPRFFFFSR